MRDIVWRKYKSEKNRQCYKYQKFVINIRCSRSEVAFSKNRRGESKTWFPSRSMRSIREKGNWLEQRLLYWPSNVERVSSIFKVLRICWKNCEEAFASHSRFPSKGRKEKRKEKRMYLPATFKLLATEQPEGTRTGAGKSNQ